ncbi:AraC family transcriptional regulator [Paenibacillus sp. LHD-117]|uniref:helix-turn-helix transcriptional regulator n=1 Tax=Paenibacillus sp. LHD-117 TaxID=3071412 RepID=UPI0027E03007|nr:AraC family transcriptional regulator [Paenibacillus sp. LHD-117]MDQ6417891.1 AraC family transcriptional regulator [Paenibacillus sp. LHD-117]
MTYPQELRENTNLSDSLYPVNLFRNVCQTGEIGRTALYLHWHEHFEIIYVAEGSAFFHIDRQQYEATPGTILIVPSSGLHVGYAATEEQITYWSLVFNRSLLDSPFHDPIHERYLSPYLEGTLRFPAKLDGGEELRPILDIILSVIQEYEQKERAYELVVKAKIHLLFTYLSRHFHPSRGNEISNSLDKRMERFKTLILYIQKNYNEKLSLVEAARMVNLTPFHFCAVFKAATGRTYVDYVNRMRMDIAERFLRNGETVTETASKVGIGNLNYFTKLFKQIKGLTPSQVKKLNP